jgi:hypothetical protein
MAPVTGGNEVAQERMLLISRVFVLFLNGNKGQDGEGTKIMEERMKAVGR